MDLILKIIVFVWVAVGTFFFVVGTLIKDSNGRSGLDEMNDQISNNVVFHGKEFVIRHVCIILLFLLVTIAWPVFLVNNLKRRRADGT